MLLIKGNEHEIESLPFEGSVKLSLNEDIHIKKITLSLVGEFYYEYMDKVTHQQYLDRLCVLKVDWGNLLSNDEGKVVFGNYGDRTIPMYKLKNLKNGELGFSASGSNTGLNTPSPGSTSGTATPTRPQALRTKSTPIFQG